MDKTYERIVNESLELYKLLYKPQFRQNSNIGTSENPFDNIDEAASFILDIESNILKYNPRSTPTIVADNYGRGLPTWKWPEIGFNSPELPDSHYFFNCVKAQSGEGNSGRLRFSLKPNLSRRKFLFRGQQQYFERCVPTLFRDPDKDYFLTEMILGQEMEVLIMSHPLVQLLGIHGFDLKGIPMELSINYGGINQHYSNHTRFLDLTSDIEVAKFFAVGDYHKSKPHYTPSSLGEESLGVLYYYDMLPSGCEFQAFAPLRELILHLSTIGKQIFPRSGAQRGFLLDMANGVNFNRLPNVYKVYFRHNRDIAKRIVEAFDYGDRLMPQSILDEYWDEKMSDSRTDRLVSTAAVAINKSRNKHETTSSLTKKLKRLGFSVSNRKPTFTNNQLEQYYLDIKNGWWQDVFCKDLSFYGRDGITLTEAFKNLPLREEYRRYFYNS